MAHVYNSQLDAFELYHQVHESQRGPSSFLSFPDGTALPALGHAIAGSVGSAISNICTYPLDLIITRLQIQRELGQDSGEAQSDEYRGVQDAARRIYANEGGLSALYTGLLQDTGKTVADSFLFFLVYNFLRQWRISVRSSGAGSAVVPPVLDELGIGFIAGSLTKLLTLPIANIVTRKQTYALTAKRFAASSSSPLLEPVTRSPRTPSTAQIAHEILHAKGLRGFWSGYSASLVLTLNPSLTFFLFETLKRLLLPRSRRENPPPSATFLLAAVSKACASTVTYPFSVAKVRAQVASKAIPSSQIAASSASTEKNTDPGTASSASTPRRAPNSTILSHLLRTVQTDGAGALYSGLPLELVKSFLSHGITMMVKQYVHRSIIHTFYMLGLLVARLRSYGLKTGAQTEQPLNRVRQQRYEYYDLARTRAEKRVKGGAASGSSLVEAVTDLRGRIVGRANETAEMVADYVEEAEETAEWRSLYGTGLARWFDEK